MFFGCRVELLFSPLPTAPQCKPCAGSLCRAIPAPTGAARAGYPVQAWGECFAPNIKEKRQDLKQRLSFVGRQQFCIDEFQDANWLWEAGRQGYLFSGALHLFSITVYHLLFPVAGTFKSVKVLCYSALLGFLCGRKSIHLWTDGGRFT